MANATEVTMSDIKSAQSCLQSFDFGSSLRMNLQRKDRMQHFFIGDVVHNVFADYYSQNMEVPAFKIYDTHYLPEVVRNLDDENRELAEGLYWMLMAYDDYYQDDFEVIEVENRRQVRLNSGVPGVFFGYKPDLVFRDNEGKIWIMDHKTTKRMQSDYDHLVTDLQAVAYQAFLEEQLGEKIWGFVYNYVLKRVPTTPKVGKSGKLVRLKNIFTTVEHFTHCCDTLGIDVDEYPHTVSEIRDNYHRWFYRYTVVASPNQKRWVKQYIKDMTKFIIDPDLFIYPSPSIVKCQACQFREPCESKRMGENYTNDLKERYIENELR